MAKRNMKRIKWAKAAGVTLLIIALAVLAVAQTTDPGVSLEEQDDRAPYYVELDRLVEMMAQIIDQVRDTYYAASQGCNAQTPEELKVNAQVVLNLLEGANSPLFDDSIEIPLYATIGMRPIVDSFEFTEGWFDPVVTSNTQKKQLENTYDGVEHNLYSSSMWIQHILADGTSYSDMRSDMVMVCRLFDILTIQIEGFLADLGYEVWCGADANLQDVIDNAREGATIYLWPSTFVGSIVITKSITINGSAFATSPVFDAKRLAYKAGIEPDSDGIGIRVMGERPIQVTLEKLVIQNASQALVVEGNALLKMEDVDITGCGVGIATHDSAQVSLRHGYVEHNDIALFLFDGSSMAVEDSFIQQNTNTEGCILLADNAVLEVNRTEVSNNAGHGIVVDDEAGLEISGSLISDNDGDGIRLLGDSQLIMNQTVCNANAGFGVHAVTAECPSTDDLTASVFTGSVVGAGNLYLEPTDSSGNQLGGLCPGDLFD